MLTPEIQVVGQRFLAVAYGNVHLEKLASGYRGAEGPAYFPADRCPVSSDLRNDRTLPEDEIDDLVSVFQHTSNFSNGHTVDREGWLICCEHLTASSRAPRLPAAAPSWLPTTKASGGTRPKTWWSSLTARCGSPILPTASILNRKAE